MEEKRILHYQDNNSDKFWIINLIGNYHEINFGKFGTEGQKQKKEFLTSIEANKSFNKLINEKLKKGYQEVKENEFNENGIIYDYTFGLLKKTEFWLETRKFFEIFDKTVDVYVHGKGIISDYQKNSFLKFFEIQNELKPKLEKTIFNYYKSQYEEFAEGYDYDEEYFPRVRNVEQVQNLISIQTVIVEGEHLSEYFDIGLLYTCKWDEEHGLGVQIKKGVIREIGQQDVCL